MKYVYTLIILIHTTYCFAQPKNVTSIIIPDVTFKQAVNTLLDAGFSVERSDSIFQTVKTEYRYGTGKNKWMKFCLLVRIKDSTAIITGKWYNTMIGELSKRSVDEQAEIIKNSWGAEKNCFIEMNVFALSFKKPVEYK